MTKQEAIEILDWIPTKGDEVDALEMAIEALQRGLENVNADSCSEKPNESDLISRQAAIDSFRYDDDGTAWDVDDIVYRLEQFPSAQPDLLDDGTLLITVPNGMLNDVNRVLVDEFGTKNCKVMYQDAERKKGHWLHEEIISSNSERGVFLLPECTCSECNIMIAYEANFCPNCGADMRGEQNGND